VTDSWKFYWDDLQGKNYLQYVPNVGHGLHGSYLPENLVSFYHMIITGQKIPAFDWHISKDTIYAQVDPESNYQISIWEAVNETSRDFKSYEIGEEAWKMEALEIRDDGIYTIPIKAPESGFKGALLEVVFNPGSSFPLTLTSGTLITPEQYPFPPFEPELLSK
jgi:PhoPQ-activated pathogenicity-related protein